MPLKLRHEKLVLQYYLKLKSNPSNSAYHCTFNPKYKCLCDKKENAIKPFGLHMEKLITKTQINPTSIMKPTNPKNPPWLMEYSKISLKLHKRTKNNSNLSNYMEEIRNILQNHPNHKHIYTDGYKRLARAECSAILNKIAIQKCLPDNASIFRVETTAIFLALDIIKSKFVIFSDLLSVHL